MFNHDRKKSVYLHKRDSSTHNLFVSSTKKSLNCEQDHNNTLTCYSISKRHNPPSNENNSLAANQQQKPVVRESSLSHLKSTKSSTDIRLLNRNTTFRPDSQHSSTKVTQQLNCKLHPRVTAQFMLAGQEQQQYYCDACAVKMTALGQRLVRLSLKDKFYLDEKLQKQLYKLRQAFSRVIEAVRSELEATEVQIKQIYSQATTNSAKASMLKASNFFVFQQKSWDSRSIKRVVNEIIGSLNKHCLIPSSANKSKIGVSTPNTNKGLSKADIILCRMGEKYRTSKQPHKIQQSKNQNRNATTVVADEAFITKRERQCSSSGSGAVPYLRKDTPTEIFIQLGEDSFIPSFSSRMRIDGIVNCPSESQWSWSQDNIISAIKQ